MNEDLETRLAELTAKAELAKQISGKLARVRGWVQHPFDYGRIKDGTTSSNLTSNEQDLFTEVYDAGVKVVTEKYMAELEGLLNKQEGAGNG